MSEMEKEEFLTRMNALSEEERELVLDTFTTKRLLDKVGERVKSAERVIGKARDALYEPEED